jgi:hypothetical protein
MHPRGNFLREDLIILALLLIERYDSLPSRGSFEAELLRLLLNSGC